MYARNRIGVIIPIYEEKRFLLETISLVPQYVDRIYVIGSNGSEKIAELIKDLDDSPRIRLLKGKGKGTTMFSLDEAYAQALADEIDIAAVVAPEHRMDPAFLSYLLDPVVWGMGDYTTGSRLESRSGVQRFNQPTLYEPSSFSNYISISKIASGDLQHVNPFKGYTVFSRLALTHLHEYYSLVGDRKLLVAIPCYNEEVSIGSVALKSKKFVDEVLVVDDGSTDATAKVAAEAGVKVISHPQNKGKAAGIATAIQYARENNFDVLILLDGDGQHETDEIPTVVTPILTGEADMVIGSRFLDRKGDIPFYRILGQKLLNSVTNLNAQNKITDSQSGFRAFSKKAIDSMDIDSEGYNIESDMISFFTRMGLTITEVPITSIYEVPHKHKKNPVSHGYDVLAHIAGELGYSRPLLMFGLSGIVFLIFGIIFGSWTYSHYMANKILPFGPSIATVLFFILGLLMISSGLILNSLVIIMKIRR